MTKQENSNLIFLDSICVYFDNKSGCFYGSLRDGKQENTFFDYTIRDVMRNENLYYRFMSKEDKQVVLDFILRIMKSANE